MGERDPDFFKLYYRQWKRRMHKLRVPYDLQGALLAIVIETHLTGGPPADDDYVLAGVMMVSPRKARAVTERLAALGLVKAEHGLIIDKTAVEDVRERSELRDIRAQAGREGGIRSGVVRRDKARLKDASEISASPKLLKNKKTDEAKSKEPFELEKSRESTPLNPPSGGKRANGRGVLIAALGRVVTEGQAEAFIAHRQAKRRPLTERAAELVARNLEAIKAAGGDPACALDLAIEHGWDTIKPDWYQRAVQRGEITAQPRASPSSDLTPEQRERYRQEAIQRQKERQH